MNIKQFQTYRMPAGLIQSIDKYEEFYADGKLKPMLDTLVKLLPNEELQILHVDACNMDKTVSVVFQIGDEPRSRQIPIEGELGRRLFIHAMCTSTIYGALGKEFDLPTVYAFSQMISEQIEVGNQSTYPVFALQLKPSDISAMLNDESVSFDVYSVVRVGQNRTEEAIETRRAIARNTVQLMSADCSENFDEVYPMLRIGNTITFNSYVPFPARIIRPHADTNEMGYVEKYGMKAGDALTFIDKRPVYLSPQMGILNQEQLGAVNREVGIVG